MSTLTITEFLLARISEDEAVARSASTGPWFRDSGWSISAPPPEGWEGPYVVVETPRARNDSEFIARHDPARVLAECAAKRAVVQLLGPALNAPTYQVERALADSTLKHLAAVYADHPEYRKAWAL